MKTKIVAVVAAGLLLTLGLVGASTSAGAASTGCSALPTNPAGITAAMAAQAARCTPSGAAAATTRQCPAINQYFPTGDYSTWVSASTWYLFPGTPDTCGSRAAMQELRNQTCAPNGSYEAARVKWVDNTGATHYAPEFGAQVTCYYFNVYNEYQFVLSAGFPSYAFYLQLQLQQGEPGDTANCHSYGCNALLRK